MRLGVATAVLSSLVLLTACGNPATNKSQAVTGEAAPVTAQAVGGQKYSITPENSKIEWVGSKVTGSHNGSFQKFTGQIDYTGNPETSRVEINIDADSIMADDPKLTAHLKTPDFFDVANFPEATFVSTAIRSGGDKGASHTVTGNLTMRGQTKSVTFPATIAATDDAITVDSNFAINRKDFGVSFAGATNDWIRDEVVLTLKIRATKA